MIVAHQMGGRCQDLLQLVYMAHGSMDIYFDCCSCSSADYGQEYFIYFSNKRHLQIQHVAFAGSAVFIWRGDAFRWL